jgi:hypothetical protein
VGEQRRPYCQGVRGGDASYGSCKGRYDGSEGATRHRAARKRRINLESDPKVSEGQPHSGVTTATLWLPKPSGPRFCIVDLDSGTIELVKRRNDRTGTGGAAIVSVIVNLDMAWIYRPQDHPGTDYGVDAHIEVTDDEGVETGRLVAAQVRSGKHYFRDEVEAGFINRPSDRHVKYWRSYGLPVILILVDEKTRIAYWAYTKKIEATDQGGWKLLVPRHQVLGATAKISLSEIAVGAGTERTRAKSEESERAEYLERRTAELEGLITAYLAQLASKPGTAPPDGAQERIDVLALSFPELVTWTDRADFVRAGVPSESRATYALAAQQLFFRTTIAEHDAAKAVTLLLLAQDWIKAGSTFLYSVDLTRQMPHVETPSIIDLLATSALPEDMPLDLRIILRSVHVAARRKHGRSVDALLEELDRLIEQASPAEGYAVTAAAFAEARATGGRAPARPLQYVRAAAALRPNATGFGGTPFPVSLDATWALMLELTAAGVASEGDLDAWLSTLDMIPNEARDAVLADEMNSVTLANRFWLDESARPVADRAWARVNRTLERIEKWSTERSAALLFASARRSRIVIRGEYEDDLRSAIRLATDVPAFVHAHPHAMFLLNEIAASQFLYARAPVESLVAFRGALATRPVNSSVLPTTLLKAAQAAAAAEEFAQARAWASDAVDAVRANRYRASTDVVVARAELALITWFGGDREAALDLWDDVTEDLFAVEEDSTRWRGLVVRFQWAGGYLANTYRTGTPPTVDAEGRSYGEPRPGAFLIDLAGQATAFSDRAKFGVLLGLAAVSDQRARDARARRWVYAALEFASDRIPEWRRMTALLALPHLIRDERFAESTALGRDMAQGWEAESVLKGADGRIVAMSFSVVPSVLAVARRPVDERASAAQMLCDALRDGTDLDGTWATCAQIVELAFLSTDDPADRHGAIREIRKVDIAQLQESPLPMLCDLAASLLPETPADTCLALHARSVLELQPRLSIFVTMFRLHVVPFFEEYWRSRAISDPQAFLDPARLGAAVRATGHLEIAARLNAILSAVARDLRLS